MSFYKTLTPYYDDIFPANEKTLAFLADHFKVGASILDVGAGTGNMAVSLAKKGFRLTAMEPEKGMAEQVRLKAQAQQLPISVTTDTMQQLDTVDGTFQGIYCIGNTLVHLNDMEEMRTFFQQTFDKLETKGVFIFQIVNFDKKDFVFPVIEKEGFLFERQYKRDGEKILFTTTLSTKERAQTNTISLYPATEAQLRPLLEACGFESITAYGNFALKAYNNDAPALIMVAKKGK
ncbi:class I SAM-dependent methyltransferase [Bacillus massilinigeriensis]|uniref:class I SAM-dependent methyltransferase n=1 Tax=Bacillus mediterraneensis TaxID=1805474 RepID=UPI0008F96616|nr:class I SAM-dependent methyltransferase [Bacillus mediterraneensis]